MVAHAPDSSISIFSRDEHSYDTWSCETSNSPQPAPPDGPPAAPLIDISGNALAAAAVSVGPPVPEEQAPREQQLEQVSWNSESYNSDTIPATYSADDQPPPQAGTNPFASLSPPSNNQRQSKPPLHPSISNTTDDMYNRVALVEQQQQHRRQKSAPPIISGMNRYHRQDSNPKPFDESSEEPSDTSTQHAQHSIYQISSAESGSTNNNNHHNHHHHHYHHTNSTPKLQQQQQQQQQREPPQQPPQNKPRWDSSDRHQFPSMDIERMKNKLQRLRAGNANATRSTSSSSEHAQAPRMQSQSSSQQTSVMSTSFRSDSAYNPFATTISSSSHQSHPKQSSTHASSSPLTGNAAYNPFGDDPPPSSGQQQQPKPPLQTTTTRRPHTERLSEATFNPFAALVKAVSSDPRTNDDANQPAANTTTTNTTIPSSFNNNNNNHPKSFDEPSDGSSSGGGSKVECQSARRGRIWSSPPTRRQDSLDEASLGEIGVLEGYRRNHNQTRSISEERSQQRRQKFEPRSKSVPRPKSLDRKTSVGSQNSSSVEQSLVQSFNRKGRRRTPSPAKKRANVVSPPSPATPSSQQPSRNHNSQPPPIGHNNNNNIKKKKTIMYPVRGIYRQGSASVGSEAPTEELDESHGETATHADTEDFRDQTEEPDFTLHDLCGEASSTDDIAWRNALCLLSMQPYLASIRDNAPDSSHVIEEEREEDGEDNHGEDNHGDRNNRDEEKLRGDQVSGGHGWTPLHISCLGIHPPPTFIIRALLYANPKAVKWRDDGGRLPLHLVAASSADVTTMELLLQAWPQAISKRDHKGLTPLHLLLRNTSVPLTAKNTSVLLGLSYNPLSVNTNSTSNNQWKRMHQEQQRFILQRRKEHLNMTLKEIDAYIAKRRQLVTTILHPDFDEVDEEWKTYPPDVQLSLRKLVKWRKKQQHEAAQNLKGRKNSRKHSTTSTLSLQDIFANDDDGDTDDEDMDDLLGDSNPAAIPHYPDLKLPIHMAVARGIVQPVPLDDQMMLSEVQFEDEDDNDEDDSRSSDSDREVRTQPQKTAPKLAQQQVPRRSSVEDVYSVLRSIIAAFPEGLCVRDADGKTPLLHIMTMTDGLPTLDLIELLLGKRTGAFDEMPPWLSGLPLHSITTLPENQNRILSPAMVASGQTNQLPLHVAAEEFLSDPDIVESIYQSYPAAVDVQDHKGRTPLHLLFSNYRLFPANPQVLSMFLSNSSAKCRDVEGNLALDLLVQAAEHLPQQLPASWEAGEMERIYQRFFTASLLTPSAKEKRHNPTDFLRQLRLLPPWIRRQACSVAFVQELIVEELSSPWRTAGVVLDGILLVISLLLFRLQVKEFTGGHLDQAPTDDNAYSASVGVVVAIRILILSLRAMLAANIGQLNYLVLFNGWFWIDLAAMVMTFLCAALFNQDISENSLLSIATATTGLLWLSVLGFCATWFFGMALLLGSLSKIANQIVWPLLAGGMVLVAFAQMFYTLLWTDCFDAFPVTPVCSVRDSYRIVYLLLRGEALVDVDGSDEISTKAVALVSAFLVVIFALLLAILVAVIIGALHTSTEEVALKSFWEPKLAFVISSADWGFNVPSKLAFRNRPKADIQTRLERTWELLISSLLIGSPPRTEKYWYAGRHRAQGYLAWAFWLLALVAIPLWLALGFLTLGFLWPPQMRRLLFKPCGWESSKNASLSSAKSEYVASQLSNIQSELVRSKTMSYERSVQVENEVRAVKHLLYAAVREE
ncbi:hypothetical protein ACA910_016406 [Epithemia clementina (nom. ined.)]